MSTPTVNMQESERKRNRPGKRRRTVGWALLALGVAITSLWAQSRWWYRGYENDSWAVVCVRGVLSIDNATGYTPTTPGATPFRGIGWTTFSMQNADPRWTWRLSAEQIPVLVPGVGGPTGYTNALGVVDTYSTPASPWIMSGSGPVTLRSPGGAPIRIVNIMLWPFAAALLGLGASLLTSGLRARRLAMTGICTRCGYSLTGLALNAKCPECGKDGSATQK